MEINSRMLKVFCAVAEAGTLQAASARVALSPSAISRMIAGLEAKLGLDLFDRSERRMELTAAGRDFQRRAREALLLLDDLAAFGRQRASRRPAPLRIAAFSRHAETLVVPAMAYALRQPAFGPIKLDMHAQRDFGFSQLARPFDIAFGHLATRQESFDVMPLAACPLVAVLPPGHPLANRDRITMDDLVGQALIVLSGDTIIGRIVREAMGGQPASVAADVSHTYLALRLVQEGVGIHLTDAMAALDAADVGCHCIPLGTTEGAVTLSAFWPRRPEGPTPRVRLAFEAVAALLARRLPNAWLIA